jgi:hypothetical protein
MARLTALLLRDFRMTTFDRVLNVLEASLGVPREGLQ